MFSEHWRSRLFSVWLALVAVLMVLVLPLPARAETPVARVTLYEVNEALRLKAVRHDDTSELKRRLAQASQAERLVNLVEGHPRHRRDRKSTRLNSSHLV